MTSRLLLSSAESQSVLMARAVFPAWRRRGLCSFAGASTSKCGALWRPLQRSHLERCRFRQLERVAQRQAEGRRLDLEYVAAFHLDAIGKGQRRRAEHVDVHVARLPEEPILEVMMLQVGDPVRHVRFA